jgi:hypothetical protein
LIAAPEAVDDPVERVVGMPAGVLDRHQDSVIGRLAEYEHHLTAVSL